MLKKLLAVQTALKAPKGQYNDFGEYNYRSCEDILEALKPLLSEHGLVLTISDSLEMIGDRYYVKAVANLADTESKLSVETVAYAREDETKKKMDGSQITGAASSYARKYALNGLFCIDDTKDADTMDNRIDKPLNVTPLKKEYKCADCGKPFKEFTDKNGKKWTAGQVYHMSQKNNADGKARCKECKKKMEAKQ